ncbi:MULTISPECIES: bacteriocin [Pseudomonas]|uniref:Bacteriocin n=1 Tax=Pseudomonas haemolytica TaxID=2600065 RepID=A0A5P1DAU7_9PSED|nr:MULTISPECIES: bacteriocin [Pseudomonas]MBJ2245333.1 bacteriocin [Pseudomonas haemolytica]MBJ2272695.1 bacteriocin [Pseudomonas haemolytica]MBJ2286269.1 bacteriocin [Pseudomonas sp. MF6755]MBK3447005.1 bacteriocin [Pseudomonas haemolytica]MBK3458501.1 bacteriocin [Pseudomonas haemolytica]
MRVLTEKELALVSGGQTTVEPVTDWEPGEFEWLGSNGGYTGPTWTSGNTSVTVGGSASGGELSGGVGLTITY